MENDLKAFPWRVLQTNFSEIDTLDFDESKFVDEVLSFHCNVILLNAAGIIASYPSSLKDHPVSDYIQDFDLKHLVERLQANGIKVIARTDFSKIRRDVYERHPEWAYRLKNGDIIDYNGYVHTCLAAGYQGSYMDEILKEMFSVIPFDGLYSNMGSFSSYTIDYGYNFYGPCHCDSCTNRFREKYGFEIPEKQQPGDPASIAFAQFQREVFQAQKTRITNLLREINPDLLYCSIDYVREECNTEFGRGLPHWQYHASSHARAIRGMGKAATVASTDMLGFFHRYVSVTPAQQELRLWQALSNFAGIDFYVFGRIDTREDRSAYDRVKKVFAYAETNESLLYGVRSKADVLLVKEAYQYPYPEERGWIRALTELHIPFDETLIGGLLKNDLSAYKLVILPEKTRLDPRCLPQIDAFAKDGGTVLCSGRVAKLDCLGIEKQDEMNDKVMGATLRIRECDKECFPGFSNRVLVPVGKSYQLTNFKENTETFGAYLFPQRFGPPEACYETEPPTSFPAVAVHSYGEGKGITVPWYPASCYYTEGYDICLLFMKDVLLNICKAESIALSVSPMVETTYGEKNENTIIHFVNGTGHFGTSFFDPEPVFNQTICIPWTHAAAECRNLDDLAPLEHQIQNGSLIITVPRINHHACIVIRNVE